MVRETFGLGNVDSVFWLQEMRIPVAAWIKAWVCGRLLVGIGGSIPLGHGCLFPLSAVCCQVEVSVTGRSLIQRNPTGVRVCFECDQMQP